MQEDYPREPVRRDESTWLAEIRKMNPSDPIAPGHEITVQDVIDKLERPPPPPGSVYTDEIEYTVPPNGLPLKLFLYAREDPSERRAGIVFIHGGAWRNGHPFGHTGHAAKLAAEGYVTATIQYRLAGEAKWPSALEDAKCAVRWMRAHHGQIGLDPSRLAASGGSAGGHLSTMIALTPGKFEGNGGWQDQSSELTCAVVWYPMTDMHAPEANDHAKDAVEYFLDGATEEKITESSPVTYVRPGVPPIFTMTGDDDLTTPVGMIQDFHRALDEAGVTNELIVYPGRGHAYDMGPKFWDQSYNQLYDFIQKGLGPA